MKVIATNRKAHFDYFISDTFEAGICLEGSEVKSLREGNANLNDCYVQIKNSEVYLIGLYIKPFEKASSYAPDSKRTRKLLLQKREIFRLSQKTKEKGLTIIPTKMYFKNNLVKVEIGLAKGKKLYDKRETLKEKSAQQEIDRASRI